MKFGYRIYLQGLENIYSSLYDGISKIHYVEKATKLCKTLPCSEGVQQGCPLGPLSYSLGMKVILNLMQVAYDPNQDWSYPPQMDTLDEKAKSAWKVLVNRIKMIISKRK